MMQRSAALLALLLTACLSQEGAELGMQVTQVSVPSPLVLSSSAFEAASNVPLPVRAPEDHDDLHHVYALSDNLICGGEPTTDEALARVASWGVKTILSVDGKVPDAEEAARLGMRYVHVPIQYKGLKRDELLAISKTFRELEGPFYVHCYHGKHRGPAAAAVGRVLVDGVSRDQAIAEMRQWCSTSSKYEGLYSAIATGWLPSQEETVGFDFDFAPEHQFEGTRAAMIAMTRTMDRLALLDDNDWQVDPLHPDMVAAEEAAQLHQMLVQSAGLEDAPAHRGKDYDQWYEEVIQTSETLVRELTDCNQAEAGWQERARAAFDATDQACKACHTKYRNR